MHAHDGLYQKRHLRKYLLNVIIAQQTLHLLIFLLREILDFLEVIFVLVLIHQLLPVLFRQYNPQQKLLQQYQIENQSDKIIHRSSALVWASLQYPVKQPAVFLNVADKHISITVADKESLLFYNQFAFTAAEDILYYCCLIFDQLKLDRSKHYLLLSGNIAQESSLYDLLYKYIHNVEFVNLDFHLDGEIDKPKHYFMDHYSLIDAYNFR